MQSNPLSLGWVLNPHLPAPEVPTTAYRLADPHSFCCADIVFLDTQLSFQRILTNVKGRLLMMQVRVLKSGL